MKLEGSYTFEAPRKVVWQALMDPEILARVMPGCEKLEETGADEYEAALKIKVGPVQGKFQGGIKLTDRVELESYAMEVNGRGPAGFMKGAGQVRLEEAGDSTIMHYSGDAQVGGRIASVGQRLLDSSAKALTRQSLEGLHKQIKAQLAPQTGEDSSEADKEQQVAKASPQKAVQPAQTTSPSEMDFALGVGKKMLEDLVPPDRRPVLIGAGLGVLALFLFLNWWSNVIARKVADEIWERR